MAKKKLSRFATISDSDILAMQETVLSLLYNNPNGLNVPNEIKQQLRTFIPFDFYHYVFRMDSADNRDSWFEMSLPPSERLDHAKPEFSLELTFEEMLEDDYQNCVKEFHDKYGTQQKFDYYRILSLEEPKMAAGLFRRIRGDGGNLFTKQDKQLLDRLAPHLFLMYRIAILQVYHSENIQYFGVFMKLASKLANDYQLSEAEVKLIPDLIFGYTNERISYRNFISVATVKSHINHILKKTNTKNRLDFLSKFFISPERVQL